MTRLRKWALTPVVLGLGAILGLLAGQPEAQQKNVLVAKKVAAAPTLDGVVDDLWKGAPALTVKVVGGKNLPGGTTEVTIRSIVAPADFAFAAPPSIRSSEVTISNRTCRAASAERCASIRTSLATTLKPRPSSPARAAESRRFETCARPARSVEPA